MADFVPSVPHESLNSQIYSDRSDGTNATSKNEQRYVGSFSILYYAEQKIYI